MDWKNISMSIFFVHLISDCREQRDTRRGQSNRAKRAKHRRAPAAPVLRSEPSQRLDEEIPEEPVVIPNAFLSPSVQEYLELGKSIPGEKHWRSSQLNTFQANKHKRLLLLLLFILMIHSKKKKHNVEDNE
jgi:hypothetical protein